MTNILNYSNGWLKITSGADSMYVWFQRAIGKYVMKPLKEIHEVAGINLVIPGGQEYLILTVQNIFLTSHSDFSTFVDTLKDWNKAGSFSVSIYYKSSTGIEWDGDNTSYTMNLKESIDGMEKVAPGTQEIFVIGQLIFIESA